MKIKTEYRLKLCSIACLLILGSNAVQLSAEESLLTVKEIMNAIITPTTATIWSAYQLQTDAQWQEVKNAALSVIAAANLLQLGGSAENEAQFATETDWKNYNQQMIAAARLVIVAAENKDEEALSIAGNDALYPPCESCHQRYQKP